MKSEKTDSLKFLILKLNHIGDALLMTPALRLLRKNYPQSQIDVVVRKGGELVMEGNPDISNLFVVSAPKNEKRTSSKNLIKLLGQRYDYAFDLSNSDRSRLWMFLSFSKRRCVNNAYGELNWKHIFYNHFSDFKWGNEHQTLKDIRTFSDILKIAPEKSPLVMDVDVSSEKIFNKLSLSEEFSPFIVIHPTSRWAFKQWIPERWAEVADALNQKYQWNILFSCGPDPGETNYVKHILSLSKMTHHSTAGKLTLKELGWLIKQSKLFLGVDTVAMHIAAAMQTPIVALFGPSSEWSWRPWECRHELVLGPCSCKKTRKFICDKSRPYPCMESITSEEVLSKVSDLI